MISTFRFICLLLAIVSSPLAWAQTTSSKQIPAFDSINSNEKLANNRSQASNKTVSNAKSRNTDQTTNLRNSLANEFKAFQGKGKPLEKASTLRSNSNLLPQHNAAFDREPKPSLPVTLSLPTSNTLPAPAGNALPEITAQARAPNINRSHSDSSNSYQAPLSLTKQPALATPIKPISTWNDLGAMPSLFESNSNQMFELSLKPGNMRISQYLANFLVEHNWTLEWAIDRDFIIHHPATFKGNFLEITTQLATALGNTDTPVKIELYNDNHVLRITYSNR